MVNTNLLKASQDELAKEIDISCFLLQNMKEGLFISLDGELKTSIFAQGGYNFEVENNKITISNYNNDESTFELNNMDNFIYQNYESCLEFTSKDKDLKINISEM